MHADLTDTVLLTQAERIHNGCSASISGHFAGEERDVGRGVEDGSKLNDIRGARLL